LFLHKAVNFLLQLKIHSTELSQLNKKTGLYLYRLQYLLQEDTLQESDYGKQIYACLVFELSSIVRMKELPG